MYAFEAINSFSLHFFNLCICILKNSWETICRVIVCRQTIISQTMFHLFLSKQLDLTKANVEASPNRVTCWKTKVHPHRIHVWYIYTYIQVIVMVNVVKIYHTWILWDPLSHRAVPWIGTRRGVVAGHWKATPGFGTPGQLRWDDPVEEP